MTRIATLVRGKWMPLATAVVVAVVGFVIYARIERNLHHLLQEQLQTILTAEVEALRLWRDQQVLTAQTAARDGEARVAILDLLERAADGAGHDELLTDPAQAELHRILAPRLDERWTDYRVYTPGGDIIAAYLTEQIGARHHGDSRFVKAALAGDTTVSLPMPARIGLPSELGIAPVGQPTMFVGGPILGDRGEVIAVLAFRIQPDADFTRILRLARMGRTGETYAFDRNGVMVSDSRFKGQLRKIGLLPQDRTIGSPFRIHIRDPGKNLVRGATVDGEPETWPLTVMARDAVSGNTGVDTEGYNDYRGVPVIGAWTWLPEFELGVTTEVDVAEAYRPLLVVRNSFRILIGLTVLVAAINIFISRRSARLEQKIEEAEELGQYRLERKIGEGGMGAVYLARHALLQRPTAVKVLAKESTDPQALERFEREVQVTAGLQHPNTIAIYDYGRTPDDVFYYAMEFLRGVTLGHCIEVTGPFEEARLVYVLQQACGSLAEAHEAGLLHRDIKPTNMMIGEQGGLYDFLKVLDFGLVRPVEQSDQLGLTNVNSLTGTPLFLSPELIQTPEEVDTRSDVYQLGVVAYYMLTAAHVFQGANIFEVCAHHLYAEPETPEQRTGRSYSADLTALIMECLAKDRDRRPRDAGVLLERLRSCAVSGAWTQTQARAWWQRWAEDLRGSTSGPSSLGGSIGTNPPTVVVDLGARFRNVP